MIITTLIEKIIKYYRLPPLELEDELLLEPELLEVEPELPDDEPELLTELELPDDLDVELPEDLVDEPDPEREVFDLPVE